MHYYTYMLRCKDNSIYTGYTNDVEKRMKAHFSKRKEGAKYTKSHDAIKLEAVWRSKDKSLACQLEYQIKHLTKNDKEKIINGEPIKTYLNEKLDCRRFYRIKIKEGL